MTTSLGETAIYLVYHACLSRTFINFCGCAFSCFVLRVECGI